MDHAWQWRQDGPAVSCRAMEPPGEAMVRRTVPLGGAGVMPAEPAADFSDRISALPWSSPRRIGLLLLQVGSAAALATVPLPIAACNICLGVAAVGALMCRPPLLRLPGFAWGLAFSTWIAVSVLTTVLSNAHPDPIHGYGLMYTWMALYLGMVAFADRRVLGYAVVGFIVIITASCLLACLQFVIGFDITKAPLRIDPTKPRFADGQGFQGLRLTQGFLMCVALLCLQAPLPLPRLMPRWARVAATLASGVALVLSRARLAYIGAVVGIFTWLAMRGRRSLLRASVVGLLVGGALLLAMWSIQPAKFHAMLRGDDQRWSIWRTSAAIIEAHPLVGSGGPEAYKDLYREYYPRVVPDLPNGFDDGASPHAHNSFLSIAAEHGLPALALYLALLWSLAWWAFRRRGQGRERARLASALIASAIAAGMFENLAGHSTPAYALFLGLAVAFSVRDEPGAPGIQREHQATVPG